MTRLDRNSRTRASVPSAPDAAAVPHRAARAEQAIDLLAGVLADAGRAFGGDMRAAALFILLAQASPRPAQSAAAQPADAPRGLSPSKLAAISGIPRETVRRKLAAMERLGCVTRDETGWRLELDAVDAAAAERYVTLRSRVYERARRFLDHAPQDRV